jgi:hypothetical protein
MSWPRSCGLSSSRLVRLTEGHLIVVVLTNWNADIFSLGRPLVVAARSDRPAGRRPRTVISRVKVGSRLDPASEESLANVERVTALVASCDPGQLLWPDGGATYTAGRAWRHAGAIAGGRRIRPDCPAGCPRQPRLLRLPLRYSNASRVERKTPPVSLGVPLGWALRSGGQAPEADALSTELQARGCR